jgi:menaquinone-9 beta-reductase
LALARYGTRLEETYGLYYKVARVFVRIIGQPELMRALVSTGMRSRTLMEWVLRIMANLLRPDELGPAEAAYRAVAALARLAPAA